MVDYIMLKINEEVIRNIINIVLICLYVFISFKVFELIYEFYDSIKRTKLREKAEPYKKEYQKLLDEKKYKEALEYYYNHSKKINWGSYFN